MQTVETKSQNVEIANVIAQQIGGRAFFMMGTKYKLAGEKSLIFDVRGSAEVNKVEVKLEPSDTYTIQFWKSPKSARQIVMGKVPVKVAEFENVYADGLKQVIESVTGLRLSL